MANKRGRGEYDPHPGYNVVPDPRVSDDGCFIGKKQKLKKFKELSLICSFIVILTSYSKLLQGVNLIHSWCKLPF